MVGTMALVCLSLLFCKPQRTILPTWPLWLILFSCAKLYLLPYHQLSMHALFTFFFALSLFYLVANYAQDLRWVYRAVGVVVGLNIVYGLCNHFGYNPIFEYQGRINGFFSDTSDLTGYLILAIPLMAHFAQGFGFLVPFFFITVFLHSYTAVICNVLSGILLTMRKGFYPLLTIVIVGASVVGFFKQSIGQVLKYNIIYRVEIWREVAKGALHRPLSGWGLGRAIELTSTVGQRCVTAKNEYLQLGFEVGMAVALVAIGFVFYMLIQRYIQAPKSWDLTLVSISLLAFAVSLLAQSYLRNPKISPTVMALLGWFYILTQPKEV